MEFGKTNATGFDLHGRNQFGRMIRHFLNLNFFECPASISACANPSPKNRESLIRKSVQISGFSFPNVIAISPSFKSYGMNHLASGIGVLTRHVSFRESTLISFRALDSGKRSQDLQFAQSVFRDHAGTVAQEG
ncbi:hypothetical protein [Shimia gijangensis]|uniref:hypothetical protein n=1 Tax=Shimia gijangensis TaxID=1470563 RepID=UPI0011147026|nr:hypothetical protein [Shimia gijangensis]